MVSDWVRQGLIGLVKAYRLLISPSLGSNCRFVPSCSAYAIEALQCHGAMAGSCLSLRRIFRCHPWCDGGLDPVPRTRPGLFTCLISTPSEK